MRKRTDSHEIRFSLSCCFLTWNSLVVSLKVRQHAFWNLQHNPRWVGRQGAFPSVCIYRVGTGRHGAPLSALEAAAYRALGVLSWRALIAPTPEESSLHTAMNPTPT